MKKITLSIEGMRCPKCEAHMNEAIESKYKVKKVSSSHEDKETIIIIDKDIADDELKNIVSETGYELKSIKKEEYEKKGIFGKLFK